MSVDANSPAKPGALDRGEATDVVDLHAAILRERPEPVEGSEPLNLWLVVFIAALLFWAGSYLTHFSGGFRADEFNESQINPPPPPGSGGGGAEDPNAKILKLGAQVYNNCSPCHQASGEGVSGQFPPLAKSDWVLADGPNRLIRIVLNGLKGPVKVNGSDYNNQMNAWRDNLSDDEIAAVLSYVRNTWGNKASFVTPAEVKAIRDATATRTVEWSAADLEAIPVSGGAAPAAGGTPAPLTLEQIKAALQKLPPDQMKELLKGLGQ